MRRVRICPEHLPTHGQGPLYSWFVGRRPFFGAGVRFSVGGYWWRHPWWRPFYKHYRRHCTHLGIGPAGVTVIWRTL